jgi:hypothetical protein
MTAIISVERAHFDTPCRKCGRDILRGQRIVLVAGTGQVHLRCLLTPAAQSAPAGGGTVRAREGTSR